MSSSLKDSLAPVKRPLGEQNDGPSSIKKQRRTKSFNGCYTCRRRKIACDLGKPSCLKCKRSGFVCEGYEVKLRWSQPIQFDKYGYQLPSKPNQETEYCQRRAIEFVQYSDEEAYKLYDEMDNDLAKLHNLYIPTLDQPTTMLGHFGVLRGTKMIHKKKKKKISPLQQQHESQQKNSPKKVHFNPPDSIRTASQPPEPQSQSQSIPLQQRQAPTSNFTFPQSSSNPAITMSNFNDSANKNSNMGNEWLSTELLDAALLTASALNGDTHFLDMFKHDNLDVPIVNTSNSNTSLDGNQISNMLQQQQQSQQQQQQPDSNNNNNNNNISNIYNSNKTPADFTNDSVPDRMLHLLFQGRNIPTVSSPQITNSPHLQLSNSVNQFDERSSTQQEQPQLSPSPSIATNTNTTPSSTSESNTDPTPTTNQNNKFSRSNQPISVNAIQIHASSSTRMPSNIMEILPTPSLPKSLAIDKFGIPTTSLNVHPMARYLLNYYIEDVADMMTVIPLPKNPWKFIYFPRALMAIGELASLGKTSNARNGLLNALLAVSAFNLQSKFVRGSEEMKYYVDLGIQLRRQATEFVGKCMEEDILTQKYKDVLVAVLSMVTIDVVWGTMSACKIHLDHCEKIIEKKMQVKKKLSSKAIILHRIFSSLKLIQDSTSLENIQKSEIFLNEKNYEIFLIGNKPTFEQLEELNCHNFRGIFRGNRSKGSGNSGQGSRSNSNRQDVDEVIDSPIGLSPNTNSSSKKGIYNEKITDSGRVRIEYIVNNDDRELESMIDSNAEIPAFIDITRTSFQPSKNKMDDKVVSSDAIYGLPNSLILMFGEVVPLTRFKKYHDDHNIPIPTFFDELAVQLEFKLLTWKLEWTLTLEDDNSSIASASVEESKRNFISPRHEGIYHHVMSFYHALIIYFYRFIEDVNPMYLQERIEKVLYHLNKIQDILENNKDTSYIIPLFWQGFVAGSEAMTLYLQNGFNKWGQCIAQTGIGTYWNARQIMLEIWRRKNHNVRNNSWVDVLRDWKTNVMLT